MLALPLLGSHCLRVCSHLRSLWCQCLSLCTGAVYAGSASIYARSAAICAGAGAVAARTVTCISVSLYVSACLWMSLYVAVSVSGVSGVSVYLCPRLCVCLCAAASGGQGRGDHAQGRAGGGAARAGARGRGAEAGGQGEEDGREGTLRNQTQDSTISVQFVPGLRFLVFDFGLSAERDSSSLSCAMCGPDMECATGLTSKVPQTVWAV
eukprot:2448202-Rhodomonas_salina.1